MFKVTRSQNTIDMNHTVKEYICLATAMKVNTNSQLKYLQIVLE